MAENETQILRCAALIGRKSKVQGSLNDEDGCVAFFLFVAYKQCGCSKVQANPTNLFNLFIEINKRSSAEGKQQRRNDNNTVGIIVIATRIGTGDHVVVLPREQCLL